MPTPGHRPHRYLLLPDEAGVFTRPSQWHPGDRIRCTRRRRCTSTALHPDPVLQLPRKDRHPRTPCIGCILLHRFDRRRFHRPGWPPPDRSGRIPRTGRKGGCDNPPVRETALRSAARPGPAEPAGGFPWRRPGGRCSSRSSFREWLSIPKQSSRQSSARPGMEHVNGTRALRSVQIRFGTCFPRSCGRT